MGSRLSVSAARFRGDLDQLYSEGFCLITPDDLADGLARLPEGRSPVMITFDDGWRSQFDYVEDADGLLRIDPSCAVGILESFCSEHPDFGRGAVFNISLDKPPFGQEEYLERKLNFLLDNGYCIGNHTVRHRSFTGLPPSLWGPALTGVPDELERFLGMRTGEIRTAAWPGGRLPEGRWVEERLGTIEYEGSPVAEFGFVVDGALADLGDVLSSGGRLRLSRVDMALYSVARLLSHNGFYRPDPWRADLRAPMPFRPVPLPE